MSTFSRIEQSDEFPLWSFGYKEEPKIDNPKKIVTSRGRTRDEAWFYIQQRLRYFQEPEKVDLLPAVSLEHKRRYDNAHKYKWLRDAPLWLKQHTGQTDLIW